MPFYRFLGSNLYFVPWFVVTALELRILMFGKDYSIDRVTEMGCCGCFGFVRKPRRSSRLGSGSGSALRLSQELLLEDEIEEDDDRSYNGEVSDTANGDDGESQSRVKRSEEILMLRTQNGMICREFPVKETHKLIRSEVNRGKYKNKI